MQKFVWDLAWPAGVGAREHIMNNVCHIVTKVVKKKVTPWH